MSVAVNVDYNVNPMVREAARSAGRSFIVGFAVNALVSGMNYTQGVAGGCVSAVAALVDTAVRALLLNLFGARYSGSLEELVVRNVIVFATVTAAATALTPSMGMTIAINLAMTIYARCIGIFVFGSNSFLQDIVVI